MTLRRLARGVAWFLAASASSFVVALAVLVWPAVRLQMTLDKVVRTVALDWRDFGRERAEERLAVEFGRIGVDGRRCSFVEEDAVRSVVCGLDIPVALGSWVVNLPVGATAALGPGGEIQ